MRGGRSDGGEHQVCGACAGGVAGDGHGDGAGAGDGDGTSRWW